MLKKRLLYKIPKEDEVIFEGEKNIVYYYSLLYAAGVAVTVSLFLFYYIPQLLYAVKSVFPGFEKQMESVSFWNSAVFMLQLLFTFLLTGYSWTKKYSRNNKNQA